MTIAAASRSPLYEASLMVANSATFQSVCGVTTAAAAEKHCHYAEADMFNEPRHGERRAVPPRAVITDASEFSMFRWQEDTASAYRCFHSLQIAFDFIVPTSEDTTIKNAYDWFFTKWYAIVNEILALSASRADSGIPSRSDPDNFNRSWLLIKSVEKNDGPVWLDRAEDPDSNPELEQMPQKFMHVGFEVEYH